MAKKLNLDRFLPSPPAIHHFCETEPALEGQSVEMDLHELLPDEEMLLPTDVEALVVRYVTGDANNADPALRAPVDIVVGNRRVRMSQGLAWFAMCVEKMQVCEDADRYGWREIAEMSVRLPTVFRRLADKAREINSLGKQGGETGVPGSSPFPVVSAGPGDTPTSPTGLPTASGVSTNDSPGETA